MKFSLSILAILGLTACANTGTHAEDDGLCEAQLGQPCTSIQQADGTRASFQPYRTFAQTQQDAKNASLSQKRLPGTVGASGKTKTTTQTASVASGAPHGGAPYHVQSYRVPEKLGSLWVAPYLGDDGIFREATYLHFVVRPGAWRGQQGRS